MNYKLAKKLKYNNFPQYGNGQILNNPNQSNIPDKYGIIPCLMIAYAPTEKELAEAWLKLKNKYEKTFNRQI